MSAGGSFHPGHPMFCESDRQQSTISGTCCTWRAAISSGWQHAGVARPDHHYQSTIRLNSQFQRTNTNSTTTPIYPTTSFWTTATFFQYHLPNPSSTTTGCRHENVTRKGTNKYYDNHHVSGLPRGDQAERKSPQLIRLESQQHRTTTRVDPKACPP